MEPGKIILILAMPFLVLVVYTFFFYTPVTLYTEAECLKKGYPEYRVSVGLERYCMTLGGAVTVQVDKQ